jgi:integrase
MKDGRHPFMVRITHKGKLKYITTGITAFPNELDEKGELSKVYKSNHKLTQPQFEQIKASLRDKLNQVFNISLQLQNNGKSLNVDELTNRFKRIERKTSFTELSSRVIEENKTAGRIGNAASIQNMLNLIREFYLKDDKSYQIVGIHKKKEIRNKVDISFEAINYTFLKGFETWHLAKGNTINSLAVYMRSIKVIYNRGINEGLSDNNSYPFAKGKYQISSSPTRKRAIPRESIEAIEKLILPENSSIFHARNIFLFSFYCMGMNFIDIANLQLKDLVSGRIEYIRQKTIRRNARSFSIKIIPKCQEILDYYIPGKSSDDYVFPILSGKASPERIIMDINNARKNFTNYLNLVAIEAGIEAHLTSYTTRHSWASLANENDVNITITSHGLGHADIKTTQIYMRNIINDEIDTANELITGSKLGIQRSKENVGKTKKPRRKISREAIESYLKSNNGEPS